MKLKLYIRPNGRGMVICDDNWELSSLNEPNSHFDQWVINEMRKITGEQYPPEFVELEISDITPGPRKE